MNAPDSIQVTLDLKFLKIAGTWKPTPDERNAAWELYVELVTRVGVIPLHDGLEPVFKLSTFMADSQVPDPPGS